MSAHGPVDRLAGALVVGLTAAMGVGGIAALIYAFGFLMLKLYDWMVACLA